MSGLLEDLGINAEGQRQAIDHDWSKTKRIAVAVAVSVIGVSAVVGGAMAWNANKPVRLPRSAQEAAAVMASDRFDSLDRSRQDQYAFEAARLMRTLSEDDVTAMFQDNPEQAREMMGRIFEAKSREATLARAYGAEVDFRAMFADFRNMRGAMRGGRGEMTDEQRQELRERISQEIDKRMTEQLQSGNPQDAALRGAGGGRGMGGFGGRGGRGGP